MKKILLSLAFMASAAAMFADNQAYLYMDQSNEYYMYGSMRRVSPNGKFATGGDYSDQTGSFLIDLQDPSKMNYIADGEAMDVTDDGLVVGCMYNTVGETHYELPGIYRDGAWEQLPVTEECFGRARAVAVTPDGKVIGGYINTYPTGETKGGSSFPCIWTYNEETEEYDLTCYNNWKALDERGFVAQDISRDGRYLAGYYNYGCSSTVPAMFDCVEQKLMLWNRLETRMEEFKYNTVLGIYPEYYIDDFHDTDSLNGFSGSFYSFDPDGNAYGYRTVVTGTEADPEQPGYGEGELHRYATIYNLAEDSFTDNDTDGVYLHGRVEDNIYFNTMGQVLNSGERTTVEDAFGVAPELAIGGIYHGSDDGKVLAGSSLYYSDVLMSYVEVPLLITLDEPIFLGVEEVQQVDNIRISTVGGRISVSGADRVAVYSLNGGKLSAAADTPVAPGVYIVTAGKKAYKVVVK